MKKFVLSLLVCCSSVVAFSQSFMHGAGITIMVGTASGGKASVAGGVTYAPRFNFMETESLSLSVGLPFSAGINGSYTYSTYGGEENTIGFLLNAPLMLNLNVGAGSTKENESRFGFFVGGGFGYHHSDFNIDVTDEYGYAYEDSKSINTFGPTGNAGIRIAVGSHQKNIEVRFSYMKGLEEVYKPNIFGVAALFNF
jgi:hypothetical protein